MIAIIMLTGASWIQPAKSQGDLPAELVQDLHAAFGDHHARAVHANGIVLHGRFTPAKATAPSIIPPALANPMPVIVRFSNFTGIPTIPDNIGEASPHGLAIKFGSIEEPVLDIVAHSFNGFPVKTSAEFGTLLLAIAHSGKGVEKPTPLDSFLGAHPIAKTFLTTQSPPPASFATDTYFGVNAFNFIDAQGARTPVRYRFAPHAGNHYLEPKDAGERGPDYLSTEITDRVAEGPFGFDWYAQLAESGDAIDDPSIAWPEERRLTKIGTIEVDRLSTDEATDDTRLLFLPGNLPHGVEAADPMIGVRNAAYPVSFGERQ
jgi:catalase